MDTFMRCVRGGMAGSASAPAGKEGRRKLSQAEEHRGGVGGLMRAEFLSTSILFTLPSQATSTNPTRTSTSFGDF